MFQYVCRLGIYLNKNIIWRTFIEYTVYVFSNENILLAFKSKRIITSTYKRAHSFSIYIYIVNYTSKISDIK